MADNTKVQIDSANQKRREELELKYQSTLIRMSNIEKALQTDVKTGVKVTQEFVSDTINALTQETELCVRMLDSNMTKDSIESLHRLNVCYLCLALGNVMGLSRMQLSELGAAAILHDIGKTEIPLQVMMQHPSATPTDKQHLERHPHYGADILAKDNSITKNVVDAIGQHHEKCDGTGYPHKRTAQNISIMAKIIAVVNTYDNLCNRYYLKRLLTPHESLSYLYTRLGEELSMDVIKTFVKTIGVYPPGSLVELSDGHMGIVVATNSAHSTRPKIILYDKATPRERPIVINLHEVTDLNIVRSLQPTELPEEVVSYLREGNLIGLFFLGSLTTTSQPDSTEVMENKSDQAAMSESLLNEKITTLERDRNTETFERRMSFRVKPTLSCGLSVLFQETEADIVDISVGGTCLSKSSELFLKSQETVMVIISIDGQRFDVKSRVIRTWSSKSAHGLQYFVSLQFLSHSAMRESLLGKKIMLLERERFLSKIK